MPTRRQRRARRRADIQLIRKALRRNICPCCDMRILEPGPHLEGCEWAGDTDGPAFTE